MSDAPTSTIMIIGNDTDFCYLMQRYVRQSGHRMIVSGTNEEATAVAQRERPAAVVLEADVPKAAGWNVLQALKADATTRDIPVLICSWLDEEERSLARGATGHLRKPVLYEDFLAALRCAGVHSGGTKNPEV